MKIDAEMKGILSMSHARDCNEHHNHYHLLVGFGYAHCRGYKRTGWSWVERNEAI